MVLRFLIDTDGRVVKSEVESSSGYARLDEAARNALGRCQFEAGEPWMASRSSLGRA